MCEIMEWGMFHDMRHKAPAHLFGMAWLADYPDPDNFLRVGLPEQIRWQNEAYTWLVEGARQVTDQGERMRILQQADRILVEEVAIMPLTYKRLHLLVKPWVTKFPTSAVKWWFLKDVIIEAH